LLDYLSLISPSSCWLAVFAEAARPCKTTGRAPRLARKARGGGLGDGALPPAAQPRQVRIAERPQQHYLDRGSGSGGDEEEMNECNGNGSGNPPLPHGRAAVAPRSRLARDGPPSGTHARIISVLQFTAGVRS
jgi:hypothetical protein